MEKKSIGRFNVGIRIFGHCRIVKQIKLGLEKKRDDC